MVSPRCAVARGWRLLFANGDPLHASGVGLSRMSERAVWTAGIRRRDAAILDTVVRDALPGLLRAARAAGISADAVEDLVHETVLVFLRRADAFDGRARASTWLQGILANKVLEARRTARREEPSDDIDAVFERQFDSEGAWIRRPSGPARDAIRDDVRRLLAGCLKGLPRRQRDAFLLREVDGLETSELCKILNVSANNVGVLLFRARIHLRACLERHEIQGSVDADV